MGVRNDIKLTYSISFLTTEMRNASCVMSVANHSKDGPLCRSTQSTGMSQAVQWALLSVNCVLKSSYVEFI